MYLIFHPSLPFDPQSGTDSTGTDGADMFSEITENFPKNNLNESVSPCQGVGEVSAPPDGNLT